MTIPKYESSAYADLPCRCKAHRLHLVFRYFWAHPSASRKEAARALKMSEGNAREAYHRLKRRDLSKCCVECFESTVFSGVCHNCGFELFEPSLPIDLRRDVRSPTNSLHPGNMLGSEVDYEKIGFTNSGTVLRRRVERGIEDSLIRGIKSDVENELKRSYPSEGITDEAGRLCVKEVLEFRARYPLLASSKHLRSQLARNVVNRLRFLHPHLCRVSNVSSLESRAVR